MVQAMQSVVISDTHFGLSSSTLKDPKKVDLLLQEISTNGNGCDEAILLGDIFDFWRARPEKAVRDSRYFLKKISEMDLKIRYIVGNHDHHLVVQKQEEEFMERVARGDLYPVYVPSLRWSQTINGLNIEMFYPTFQARRCHRNFLFAHGHHLDGFQTLSLQVVEQLRRFSGEERSPADLEMMMTYTYESIYRSSYIGEMVTFEDRLWNASNAVQRFKSGVLKKLRFTPVERHYEAILQFICDQNNGMVDCFLYGDTHQADIYQRKGGPLAVNTGSFTREEGKCSGYELPDTYVLINEDGLAMRQLGKPEPIFLCEFF
jgi:UDP-2,3-diacylglucosamine pyrophosphatase LpxH